MRLTFRRHELALAEWRAAATRERHYAALQGPEPIVRPGTDEDTPAILNLIASSHDRESSPLGLEHWRWKHQENPFGVSPCLVAESNGELAGVRVFLRWNWYSEGRCIRTVRAVDTTTQRGWRGRGVFSRLTMRLVEQVQREGVSFIYNTPNDESLPGYLKLGWNQVGRIPLWIRPIRLSRLVKHAFARSSMHVPAIETLGTIAQVLSDQRLPAFLADVSPNDRRYHTARTPGYLHWRYRTAPGMSFAARFEMNGDAGALIIAGRRLRGRLREIAICELLVTPSARGVQIARTLLSDLVSGADADYIAGVAARGTTERAVLARAGFFPVPRIGPRLAARRLSSVEFDPFQWANWRCSLGDLELFDPC